jgi:type II secretory pathway pseudopilin PulG
MAAIEMLVVILLLALLGVLAVQLGVDTSDSSTDPRRPGRPVDLS